MFHGGVSLFTIHLRGIFHTSVEYFTPSVEHLTPSVEYLTRPWNVYAPPWTVEYLTPLWNI